VKILRLRTFCVTVPFNALSDPDAPRSSHPGAERGDNQILLLRLETDRGIVGWGEPFSYGCMGAVREALHAMVAPLVVGCEFNSVDDIRDWSLRVQRALHYFGRYGITMYAISGVDIALWDAMGKLLGRCVADMLGGRRHERFPGYASLVRYSSMAELEKRIGIALREGYRAIKLHQETDEAVRLARRLVGPDVELMLDVSSIWTEAEALALLPVLREHRLLWVEEPTYPPEDYRMLARLNALGHAPIAAGENISGEPHFRELVELRAVDFMQPSVTKVGGITEMAKIADLSLSCGVKLMPHSPYFGPGFIATLQMMSAFPGTGYVERYHIDLDASLYGKFIDATDGDFAAPDGPGLGIEPDLDTLASSVKEI
jgi:L-alanine-DL-glutamate epimerase-like enolase superfamily enzyme